MRIGVIGGGSLGLLVSSYLSDKHEVTLYVRRDTQLNKIRKQSIILNRENRQYHKSEIVAEHIDNLMKHDIIFIAVKQPEIEGVIRCLSKLDNLGHLIFLQNGMGHIEKIRCLSSSVYIGVVEHGATRISDNEVSHLGLGIIKLAALNNHTYLKLLQEELHDSRFPFEINKDYNKLLKSKLLINAVINPLTALFNVPNGAIVSNSYIMKLARQLTEEIAFVLQLNLNKAWESVQAVAYNTRENTSSMRADVLSGRKTEVDAILGYILAEFDEKHLQYTSIMYKSLMALEERGKY